jgi:hypothetical protein
MNDTTFKISEGIRKKGFTGFSKVNNSSTPADIAQAAWSASIAESPYIRTALIIRLESM